MSRRFPGIVLVALAAVLALVALAGGPIPEAHAATPDLTVVTSSRYEVKPDEARVAITVDLTVTNRLKDTVTRQFSFDRAYIAVMPGTANFKVTAGTGTATPVLESKQATYWLLRLAFGSQLTAGKSITFRLTMDLKDPGGTPTRTIRISPTLVSFPVWAYGSAETPGSSVAVTFPADYAVQFDAGKLAGPRTEADGRRTWTATGLADALAFYGYVVADKPGAYTETSKTVDVGGIPASLLIRSWPDDPDWAKRVGGLFERAFPVLGSRIGLPWPRTGTLVVQEAVSRTSGGYAGLFDAAAGKVEVAYYAGSLVILHEAAHAWFNGSLLADRWANEGFASWYGLAAADALGEKVTPPALTDALKAKAIPLNAWGVVGATPVDNEEYAYAASLAVAREIAARAGDPGLQRVWAAAARGLGAYQPPSGAPELVDAPPDWRGVLDLLEADGQPYGDLWTTLVARPEDLPLLEARTVARADYEALVKSADTWRLPRTIRDALRGWQFTLADTQMQLARAVLVQRSDIAADARGQGLTPPETLRTLFERDDSLETALQEAASERITIAAYAAALDSRPWQLDPVRWAGLLGVQPDAELAAARAAFAEGRLADAEAAAGEARLAWLSAPAMGQARLISAGLLALATVILVAVVVVAARRRRTHRAALRPGLEPMASRPGTARPDSVPRESARRGAARRDAGHRDAGHRDALRIGSTGRTFLPRGLTGDRADIPGPDIPAGEQTPEGGQRGFGDDQDDGAGRTA